MLFDKINNGLFSNPDVEEPTQEKFDKRVEAYNAKNMSSNSATGNLQKSDLNNAAPKEHAQESSNDSDALRAKAIELMKEKYPDFDPATEGGKTILKSLELLVQINSLPDDEEDRPE
jgi:hypothetical protein